MEANNIFLLTVQTIKKSFQDLYNNLFFNITLSLLWTLSVFTILGIGPVWAGIYMVMIYTVQNSLVDYGDFWSGIKKYWVDGLLAFFILIFLILNTILSLNYILHSTEMIQFIIALIYVAGIIYLLLAAQYILPLVVKQDESAFSALGISLNLVYNNLLFVLLIGLTKLIFLALFYLILPLGAVIGIVFLSLIGSNSLMLLLHND